MKNKTKLGLGLLSTAIVAGIAGCSPLEAKVTETVVKEQARPTATEECPEIVEEGSNYSPVAINTLVNNETEYLVAQIGDDAFKEVLPVVEGTWIGKTMLSPDGQRVLYFFSMIEDENVDYEFPPIRNSNGLGIVDLDGKNQKVLLDVNNYAGLLPMEEGERSYPSVDHWEIVFSPDSSKLAYNVNPGTVLEKTGVAEDCLPYTKYCNTSMIFTLDIETGEAKKIYEIEDIHAISIEPNLQTYQQLEINNIVWANDNELVFTIDNAHVSEERQSETSIGSTSGYSDYMIFEVHKLNLETGEDTLVGTFEEPNTELDFFNIYSPVVSEKDNLLYAIVVNTNYQEDNNIIRMDLDTGETELIYSGGNMSELLISPDESKLFFAPYRDTTELVVYDLETQLRTVFQPPEGFQKVYRAFWSPDGKEIILGGGGFMGDDKDYVYSLDIETGKLQELNDDSIITSYIHLAGWVENLGESQ